MRTFLFLWATAIVTVAAGSRGRRSPPLTDLDLLTGLAARVGFSAEDIKFEFPPASGNPNGGVSGHNIGNDPFLATLPKPGVSAAVVTLGPCALNQPHVHPRGTEYAFVTKGELRMGFHEENGGRGVLTTLVSSTESFIFPQGLLHFAINPTCEEAQFVAFFPSTDAATQTMAPALLAMPEDVLRATVGSADLSGLDTLRNAIVANPNPSVDPECMAACML